MKTEEESVQTEDNSTLEKKIDKSAWYNIIRYYLSENRKSFEIVDNCKGCKHLGNSNRCRNKAFENFGKRLIPTVNLVGDITHQCPLSYVVVPAESSQKDISDAILNQENYKKIKDTKRLNEPGVKCVQCPLCVTYNEKLIYACSERNSVLSVKVPIEIGIDLQEDPKKYIQYYLIESITLINYFCKMNMDKDIVYRNKGLTNILGIKNEN